MAKRHLKPTGDLGRVVFIVCLLLRFVSESNGLGIRSPQQPVNRGKCSSLRCGVQPRWPPVPYEVSGTTSCGFDANNAGISRTQTSTSTEQSASLKQLPSTTLTDLSTFRPTMPARTRFPNISPPRSVSRDYDNRVLNEQGWGEEITRSIFPETTIVRPAPMFGFEDNLLHRLAGITNLFTSNHMQERYWPVHVGVTLPTMTLANVVGYRCRCWSRAHAAR